MGKKIRRTISPSWEAEEGLSGCVLLTRTNDVLDPWELTKLFGACGTVTGSIASIHIAFFSWEFIV